MLAFRAVLSAAMVLCGIVVLARMLAWIHTGGLTIVPGIVLGTAMIALGVHKLSLILRAVRGRAQ